MINQVSPGEVILTINERNQLAETVKLSQRCSDLNREIRESNIREETKIVELLNKAWPLYEELMAKVRILVQNSSNRAANELFKGCYEAYVYEYSALKIDSGKLLENIRNEDKLRSFQVIQTECLAQHLEAIKEFEKSHLYLIDQQFLSNDNGKLFFTGLFILLKKSLWFLKEVFAMAEMTEDFAFAIAPDLRLGWQVMMFTEDDSNKEEIEQLHMIEAKTKDFINLLSRLTSDMIINKNNGKDITYEKIDSQNKFNSVIQSIAAMLSSREMVQFRQIQSLKFQHIMQEESNSGFMATIANFQYAISKEDFKYLPTDRNPVLSSLCNIVLNMLDGLAIAETLMEFLPVNVYQYGLLANFVKNFGLRVFTVECFARLEKFNEKKRKSMLIG